MAPGNFRVNLPYDEEPAILQVTGAAMGEQETQNFLGLNFIIIGGVALIIFGYLVMLIRKRWKQNFLHSQQAKKSEP